MAWMRIMRLAGRAVELTIVATPLSVCFGILFQKFLGLREYLLVNEP